MWIGRRRLLLLALCLCAAQTAPAQQQVEPPPATAAPDATPALPAAPSDTAPVPGLPTPLGAGASVGAPPTRPRTPLPPRPPAGADASAALPAAGNDASAGSAASGGDNGTAALFGSGAGGGPSVVPGLTRRLPYSLVLSVSGAYDDNPSLSRGRSGGDYYFSFSPTFIFGLDNLVSAQGNFLHFLYSPVFTVYANHSEDDSIQHLIGLAAQYGFGRFSVSARQTVQILDGTDTAATSGSPGTILQPGQTAGGTPIFTTGTINQANVDVSGRSRLNIYDTSVNAAYGYSSKLSLSGGIQYSVSAYSNLISSQTLSGNLYADYVYSLKTVIGAGFTGGREYVDQPTPSQDFMQFNLRTSYRYSEKFSLAGSFGAEFRKSDDQSQTDVTPIFDLSATYQPTRSLTISLAATRSQQNSAVLAGQNYQSTTFTASASQIINSRFSAGMTLGYGYSHYVSEANTVQADRDENYYTAQLSLTVNVRPDVGLRFFYLRRQNSSSGAESRSFSNNQAGVSASYQF